MVPRRRRIRIASLVVASHDRNPAQFFSKSSQSSLALVDSSSAMTLESSQAPCFSSHSTSHSPLHGTRLLYPSRCSLLLWQASSPLSCWRDLAADQPSSLPARPSWREALASELPIQSSCS